MIIYKATNTINGTVYIGQTKRTLKRRIIEHEYAASKRLSTSIFYNAIIKYGVDNFKWEVIAETKDNNKLNSIERFYIAAYGVIGKTYNIKDGGINGEYSKYKKIGTIRKIRAKETKKRVYIYHSLYVKRKYNNPHKGIPLSLEEKAKRRESRKGKYYIEINGIKYT